jgi:hypothetical protein
MDNILTFPSQNKPDSQQEDHFFNCSIKDNKPIKTDKSAKFNDLDRLIDSLLNPNRPKRKRSIKKTA